MVFLHLPHFLWLSSIPSSGICLSVCLSVCLSLSISLSYSISLSLSLSFFKTTKTRELAEKQRQAEHTYNREQVTLDQMARQLEQQHLSDMVVLQNARQHIEHKREETKMQIIRQAQAAQVCLNCVCFNLLFRGGKNCGLLRLQTLGGCKTGHKPNCNSLVDAKQETNPIATVWWMQNRRQTQLQQSGGCKTGDKPNCSSMVGAE